MFRVVSQRGDDSGGAPEIAGRPAAEERKYGCINRLRRKACICGRADQHAIFSFGILADWTGEITGEPFGISVTLGGRAIGDGRVHLLVGSSTNVEERDNAGKVSLLFGLPIVQTGSSNPAAPAIRGLSRSCLRFRLAVARSRTHHPHASSIGNTVHVP